MNTKREPPLLKGGQGRTDYDANGNAEEAWDIAGLLLVVAIVGAMAYGLHHSGCGIF